MPQEYTGNVIWNL